MRRVVVIALLCLPVWCQAQSLSEARKLLQKGNYSEAAEAYRDLLKKRKDDAAAAIGLFKSLKSEGKYDDATAALQAGLKEQPGHADLLAHEADWLFARGRWDEAEKSAKKSLEKNDDHFLARWTLARLTRDKGDWDKAKEDFRWFVKAYNRIDTIAPDDLLLVGQASTEYARYHHFEDEFKLILNTIYADAIKEDPLLWQAEYLKADLLLEKHNKAEAEFAWTRALTINPSAAEVKALRGNYALSRFEIKEAEQFADEALDINPNLPEAVMLKADIHLFSNEPAAALKELARLKELTPRDETLLAQLAVCQQWQRKPEEFAKIVKTVESFNPKPHVFYTQLAERLDRRKFYGDAEKYFKKAVELEPQIPWALNGLGMLHMRMGDEVKAREILTKAFDADPFNIQVSNSIKVLDHLKKYKTENTKHYVFRYDPKNDELLAKFMIKAFEEIHKEFEEKFDFKPKAPYLVELFSRHEMFSGRVVALPDLHTIGACTGRMMAMASPRDRDGIVGKPFNWRRVVRHEVVHLFNLEQTNFQIPHWFTEGLAVTLEGTGNPPSWDILLARKLSENDLLNLDNILLGFVRPRSPDQWQQAYLQSQLYVEYLMKTHGDKSVGKLLAAFADGLDTDAALEKAINTKKADFEKGYRAFLEERVKNLKVPSVRKQRTMKQLKDANAKNPDDVETAAELAEAYTKASKYREADKLVNGVLQAKPNHPYATYVKAVLALRENQVEDAMGMLKASMRADPTEPKVIRLLALMQLKLKKKEDAAETLEIGRKLEPAEGYYVIELAKIYRETKEKDKLIDILKDLARLDYDSLEARKLLAQHYQQKGDYPMAEKYARQCLDIVVDDAEVQEILLESLEEQKKDKELAEFKKLFGQ